MQSKCHQQERLFGSDFNTYLHSSTRPGHPATDLAGFDKASYTLHTHTLRTPSWADFDLLDRKPGLTRICEIHSGWQTICQQLVAGAGAWSSLHELNSGARRDKIYTGKFENIK